MTRDRVFGSDTDFCDWMRHESRLPSASVNKGICVNDNDVLIHRYMSSVDGLGTREVQGIMQVEVKTRNGLPRPSQLDTLSKLHLFHATRECSGEIVRFFGAFVLSMSGTRPDNSDQMKWGCIPRGEVVKDSSLLRWTVIDIETLIKILAFELHPQSLTTQPFRRHHKTQQIYVQETTPLGFISVRPVTKRS